MRRFTYSLKLLLCCLMLLQSLWAGSLHAAFAETAPLKGALEIDKRPPQGQVPAALGSPKAQDAAAALQAEQERLQKGGELLYKNPERPSMISQAIALSLLSLTPFIIMILSSFLKIVVVLSLLRTALGVAQSPPNQILNGVAFMLSLYVMYPTAMAMYKASESQIAAARASDQGLFSTDSPQYIISVAEAAREPLRDFLQRNSSVKHQGLFYRMAYRILPEDQHDKLKPNDFMIVVPAFITSQLKDAFEIGVLIYIPFFVIDLVTSNILLAMGMMMLSPVTISMPLKLFLLVMLDGWTLLIEGLVLTFR